MGAAAYVGRVGGLAVALGVGSAVFAGQPVAWADDTDSGSPSSSSSATSESAGSDSSDQVGGTGSGGTGQSADSDEPDDDETPPGEDDDAADEDELAEEAEEAEDELDATEDAAADDTDSVGAEPVDDTDDAEPVGDTDDTGDAASETDYSGDAGPASSAAPQPEAAEDDDTGAAAVQQEPTAETGGRTAESDEKTAEIAEPTASTTTPAGDDPAQAPKEATKVAVFANASTMAAATTMQPVAAAPRKFTLATAVVNVVNSMIDWARQKAAADPGSAPPPPFMWALMSFARRELENLFAANMATSLARSAAATPTSLALAADATADATAAATVDAAAAAALVPYSPFLNPQLSTSTNFVSWVTGPYIYSDPTLGNTNLRYDVYGTDVGTMWDNGMVDDPSTPWNEHQVLIAVGDTFGSANMTGRHIYNTLFRSSDDDLSDGMTIPDGEWFNGNMFGGAPLSGPTEARPIINRPSWLPGSVTLIPTAGISLPTEVTEDTPFGTIQYVSFMSVSNWGSAGRWSTNYSAIAYSTDNGENFTVAPESVRYNSIFSGNKNFQQSAFVKGDDGYVYMYGTPNGRQGGAYLARVASDDILDVDQYQYYKKASSGFFGFGASPAKWVKNSPSSASAIIGKSGGACASTKPGYTVSEMSVQYNDYLDKYVVMYGDQFNNIVIRTSDKPQGGWSEAKVLISQQSGGIYAPMMHPWSPSTVGTGSDLYWNLSLWSEYNIMLMRTDLTKI